MRYLFILLAIFFASFHLMANFPDPVKQFNREKMRQTQCFFMDEFSTNKTLDDDFALPALVALSFYPELRNSHIRFRQKNIKTTMQCLPRFGFLFRSKEQRVYQINIDNKVRKNKGLLLSEVPFNAQIGVIGHELAHVVDYHSKSKSGIILFGMGYLFPRLRRKAEHRIDEITIAHGLGHQLKDFSLHIEENERISKKYRQYKQRYYYQADQLQQILLQYPIY